MLSSHQDPKLRRHLSKEAPGRCEDPTGGGLLSKWMLRTSPHPVSTCPTDKSAVSRFKGHKGQKSSMPVTFALKYESLFTVGSPWPSPSAANHQTENSSKLQDSPRPLLSQGCFYHIPSGSSGTLVIGALKTVLLYGQGCTCLQPQLVGSAWKGLSGSAAGSGPGADCPSHTHAMTKGQKLRPLL